MNQNKIEKILQNHEKRIVALEGGSKKIQPVQKQKGQKSLSDYILELRDEEFFSQPKTVEDVYKKLQSNYSCALDRVDTALRRIADRKQLRKLIKTISDKKYKAYVW